MIMQITTPTAPPASYLSTLPSSSTFTAMPSGDVTFRLPSMRRVISSPSKHTMQLRDAAKCCLSSAARSHSHRTMTQEHDHADEPLPAFLRDEYFTKQAIKQMAEHRVMLDARKTAPTRDAAEDDEYAWYFKNPHRYVWRPRDRRSGTPRSRMVLHGELGEERDAEMNRSLFASYLVRHYGSTPILEGQDGGLPSGVRQGSVHAREDASLNGSDGPRSWGVDVDESDGSTVFWIDEWDRNSSPTVENSSLHRKKLSGVSSGDDLSLPRRSTSSEKVSPQSRSESTLKYSKKRWSSSTAAGDAKGPSSFRMNTTRVRAGTHRRFSLFRLFSS